MEPCLWLAAGLMDYAPARNPKNEISVDVISARKRTKFSSFIKKVFVTLFYICFPGSAILCSSPLMLMFFVWFGELKDLFDNSGEISFQIVISNKPLPI